MFKKEGNNSQKATNIAKDGGTVHNVQSVNNYYGDRSIDMAISELLKDIFDHVTMLEQNGGYNLPAFEPFSIQAKIDHNEIDLYRNHIDDYIEFIPAIRQKITIIADASPSYERKIFTYIASKYRMICGDNKSLTPDQIISKLTREITEELNKSGADLTREESQACDFVIFYVFSQCKIFKKPPDDFK